MDYYNILEINKNASDDDIKNAYKKLAVKHHPDKNQNRIESQEKFKKIAEAYQVLSDKNKRRLYDNKGISGLNSNFINFDAFNIFNKFFGEVFPSDIKVEIYSFDGNLDKKYGINKDFMKNTNENFIKKEKTKTEPLYYNINCSLEDIYMKKNKIINLDRIRYEDDKYIKKSIEYNIPLYLRETIFYNEGDDSIDFHRNDVIVNIYDKPHDKFTRINDFDLLYSHHVNLFDIYNGFSFNIQHLDNQIIKIISRPESMISQGHLYQIIENLGLYNDETKLRGNLIIRYVLEFPLLESKDMNILFEVIGKKHNKDNLDYEDINSKDDLIEAKNIAYEEIYMNE